MKHFLFAVRPLALDFLSTVVFLAVFSALHNVVLATALGIAAGVGEIAWQKLRGRHVSAMEWMSLALVVVMGGATLLTHDPRFIMIKPTVSYICVGAVMLKPGWMIRYMPPIARARLSDRAFVGWGYAWAGLMFATAALNLILATTVDARTWASAMSIAALGGKATLFAIQYTSTRFVVKRRIVREMAVGGDGVLQAA